MSDTALAFLSRLGLAYEAAGETLTEAVAPSNLGRGLVAHKPSLASAFEGALELSALSAKLLELGGAHEAVVASRSAPGLFACDTEGFTARMSDGVARAEDGRLIVDAQLAPQQLLLEREGVRALLEFEGSSASLFPLSPAEPLSLPVPSPLSLPGAPPMDSLLADLTAPAWLAEAYARDSGGSLLARCEAVGRLGRLWSTAAMHRASGPAALDALLRGEDPGTRARAWFAALDEVTREELFAHAQHECDLLAEELEGLLLHAAEGERAFASRLAVRWLERRDDLESLAVLAAKCEGVEVLRQQLGVLDDEARTHATLWRDLAPLRSEQLDTSASEDVGTWWTELR